MNSSTAAANDSVRDSTSSRRAFQDANPYSRATADWASCSARSEAPTSSMDLPESEGRTANRRSAFGSRALTASSRAFACFFSCSRFGRAGSSRDGIQPPCFSPVVRRQAARRCSGRWSSSYDGGLGPSREPAGALSAHNITLVPRIRACQCSSCLVFLLSGPKTEVEEAEVTEGTERASKTETQSNGGKRSRHAPPAVQPMPPLRGGRSPSPVGTSWV